MSVGQTVEVRVLERLADGRFLVGTASTHLTAEAEPSLRPGQTLTMRVDSLQPRVVLSMMPSSEERLVAECLRGFRSNPSSLTQSLADLAGMIGGNRMGELVPRSGIDALAAILDALRSVLSGRERIGEGFSLPDFARTLGLLTESDLKKVLERPGEHPLPASTSLKAGLIQGLRELQARRGTEGPASAEAEAIGGLIPTLEKALRAIEGQQLLNVHLQQSEGKLLFQMPLLYAGIMGNANILIRHEKPRAGAAGRNGTFRVFFALEMDALGDVMAQAHFNGNAVSCSMFCENDAAAAFVDGLFPDLKDRLSRAGYRVSDLGVRVDSRVRETMEERFREEICGDGAALSVFA